MKTVPSPSVYLVAYTTLNQEALAAYLRDVGLSPDDWFPDPRVSDAENLLEVGGRMCYRSWIPWDPAKPEASNPNVTKGRIRHILGRRMPSRQRSSGRWYWI